MLPKGEDDTPGLVGVLVGRFLSRPEGQDHTVTAPRVPGGTVTLVPYLWKYNAQAEVWLPLASLASSNPSHRCAAEMVTLCEKGSMLEQ